MSKNNPEIAGSELDSDQVRAALDSVLGSEAFDGATRLQEFLAYVVEATLEGRRDRIPAKQISEDVYGRPAGKGIDNENVVRVDAGRLRRRRHWVPETEASHRRWFAKRTQLSNTTSLRR